MTASDVVVPLITLVVGLLGGYIFGVARDQQAALYKERINAVIEIRARVLKAATTFTHLAYETKSLVESVWRGTLEERKPEEINQEVSGLAERARGARDEIAETFGVYETKHPFLEARTRHKFEALANPLRLNLHLLEGRLRHPQLTKGDTEGSAIIAEFLREGVSSAAEWADGEADEQLPALRAAFEAEVERVVGARRPWWRRWFGS